MNKIIFFEILSILIFFMSCEVDFVPPTDSSTTKSPPTSSPGGYTLSSDGTSLTIYNNDGLAAFEKDSNYDSTKLTSVTIGSGVTSSISYDTFQDCSNLTSITISENNAKYKSYGNCIYYYNTANYYWEMLIAVPRGLTSVTIPDSVTSIGSSAFSGCSKLTSITIGNSISSTHISSDTFSSCTNVETLVVGNGFTSLSNLPITAALKSITIGSGVTSISYYTFEDCSNLTSITISENNKNYKSYENCVYSKDGKTVVTVAKGLTSAIIHDDANSIDSYAFKNCNSLTSVIIPNNVTSVGSYAFRNCSSLTGVTIGSGVTSISNNAFDGCSNLTSLTISENNKNYKSYKNCVYTKDGKTVVAAAKGLVSVIIHDDANSINSSAFNGCNNIETLVIGDGITSLSNLPTTPTLKSITIGNSVTSISYNTFKNYSNLTSITISENNAKYKSYGNCVYTKDGKTIVTVAKGLTSVIIPNDVTSISQYAFSDCNLTSVIIPDSVTSIGSSAFSGCDSLENLIIGNSITSLQPSSFSGCNNVETLIVGNGITSLSNLPITVALKSITIGSGVTSISYNAFEDCSNLTSLTISESNKKYKSCENCVYTKDGKLVTVAKGLTSVTIGDDVTSIDSYAFKNCNSLTSVIIPNNVTSVGSYAFESCSDLTSVTIGNGVTSIGEKAFQYCNKLTSIIIPSSVTSIGSYAFRDCNSLKTIHYRGTEEQWNEIIFYNRDDCILNATIHYNYTE